MITRSSFDAALNAQGPAEDLKHRTMRSGALAMGAEGVEFFLRLGSLMVLAHLLVPEYFGLVAMVTAITAVAEQFKDLGLSVATIQRKVIRHEIVSTLFWINLGTGVLVTMLVCALAVPIARFYGEPRLVPICLALAASFVFGGATIQHQALLRRRMHFGRLAAIQIASSALSVVLAVGLALSGAGYWALVAREVSRAAFQMVGTWICMPWLPGPPARHAEVRPMLSFGGDVTAFNLVYFVTSSLDQILIGRFFGALSLGLYRQGVNLVLSPIAQLTFPVQTVAESTLSQLQDAVERYRRYYRQFLMVLASFTMPLAAFLAVFADDIATVALGERWDDAAVFVRILAIAAIIRPARSTVGFVMMTCGKSRRYLWLGVAHAALLVAFMAFGLRWGAEGIAWAHVAVSYVPMVPFLVWSFKGTPINLRIFFATIATPAFATALMVAATQWFLAAGAIEGPVHRLVIGAVVAMVAYIAGWLVLPGGRHAIAEGTRHLAATLRRGAPKWGL